MTQAAVLKTLPVHVSRGVALILISVATIALIALSFAVGRWTADTSGPPSVAPAVVQPAAPALLCHLHGPC